MSASGHCTTVPCAVCACPGNAMPSRDLMSADSAVLIFFPSSRSAPCAENSGRQDAHRARAVAGSLDSSLPWCCSQLLNAALSALVSMRYCWGNKLRSVSPCMRCASAANRSARCAAMPSACAWSTANGFKIESGFPGMPPESQTSISPAQAPIVDSRSVMVSGPKCRRSAGADNPLAFTFCAAISDSTSR